MHAGSDDEDCVSLPELPPEPHLTPPVMKRHWTPLQLHIAVPGLPKGASVEIQPTACTPAAGLSCSSSDSDEDEASSAPDVMKQPETTNAAQNDANSEWGSAVRGIAQLNGFAAETEMGLHKPAPLPNTRMPGWLGRLENWSMEATFMSRSSPSSSASLWTLQPGHDPGPANGNLRYHEGQSSLRSVVQAQHDRSGQEPEGRRFESDALGVPTTREPSSLPGARVSVSSLCSRGHLCIAHAEAALVGLAPTLSTAKQGLAPRDNGSTGTRAAGIDDGSQQHFEQAEVSQSLQQAHADSSAARRDVFSAAGPQEISKEPVHAGGLAHPESGEQLSASATQPSSTDSETPDCSHGHHAHVSGPADSPVGNPELVAAGSLQQTACSAAVSGIGQCLHQAGLSWADCVSLHAYIPVSMRPPAQQQPHPDVVNARLTGPDRPTDVQDAGLSGLDRKSVSPEPAGSRAGKQDELCMHDADDWQTVLQRCLKAHSLEAIVVHVDAVGLNATMSAAFCLEVHAARHP